MGQVTYESSPYRGNSQHHPAAPIPRHDLALAQILEERPEVVPSVNRLDKKPLGQNIYRNIGIYQIIYP
jgi:hypothetical protein